VAEDGVLSFGQTAAEGRNNRIQVTLSDCAFHLYDTLDSTVPRTRLVGFAAVIPASAMAGGLLTKKQVLRYSRHSRRFTSRSDHVVWRKYPDPTQR